MVVFCLFCSCFVSLFLLSPFVIGWFLVMMCLDVFLCILCVSIMGVFCLGVIVYIFSDLCLHPHMFCLSASIITCVHVCVHMHVCMCVCGRVCVYSPAYYKTLCDYIRPTRKSRTFSPSEDPKHLFHKDFHCITNQL